MERHKMLVLVLLLAALTLATNAAYADLDQSIFASTGRQDNITVKRDLLALMLAYPNDIIGVERDANACVYVVMASGAAILYDDGLEKSFAQKLSNADLQDMMAIPYPLSPVSTLRDGNDDPGRIRVYAFFDAVYGNSKPEVEKNLETVSDGTKLCAFNSKNGAANALEAVFADLAALIRENPTVHSFVYPTNGTFNYRVIAGTGQLSPHAYAIAIDLCTDPSDYWRWAGRERGQQRLSVYPPELVETFERHGFIWGGKWAHFDFPHYEYRPELILKAQCAPPDGQTPQPWHAGFPDTARARMCITMIEDVCRSEKPSIRR